MESGKQREAVRGGCAAERGVRDGHIARRVHWPGGLAHSEHSVRVFSMGILKSCPWCDVVPSYDVYGYYHLGTESREIRCENALCKVRPHIILDQDDDQFDLEEAWNRRADGD